MTGIQLRTLIPLIAGAVVLAACSHSGPFDGGSITPAGPDIVGSDVRLTTNAGQDYWPSWSEDGAGILYRFAQPGHADDDRCIGLLPAGGGTRLWSMCDNRFGQADSSSSFAGAALGADGRLLYEEIIAKANANTFAHNILWLADSAAPFGRQSLITFPVPVGATLVTALNSVQWTAKDRFIAEAQDVQFTVPCRNCLALDTTFVGLMVVTGSITSTSATLAAVDGTAGAYDYSLAAKGALVVFVRSALNVEQVPISGGTPTLVTSFGLTGNRSILGLTCKGASCIVLTSEPNASPPTHSLWKLSLTDGSLTLLRTSTTALRSPKVAPGNGDLVVQSGLLSAADLYLFKGLLP